MATEFKIEKGIAPPASNSARYPFADMEINDSFFVPTGNDAKSEGAVRTAAYNHKRDGRAFTVSRVDGGVRVWRLA